MLSFCCHGAIPRRKSPAFSRLFSRLGIIPTPQIALQIKQFCLGDLSCGISIIHFVLYCTWLLMLRYHFVSTFDNELCNLWRQCVPGGLLLIWYYSAGWGGLSRGFITHLKCTYKSTPVLHQFLLPLKYHSHFHLQFFEDQTS